MEMQELICIEAKPAVMSVNFDELKTSLGKELEKYDVVVTADTVADAKKLATQLNANKKVIDDRRKAEVANASVPVKAFDAKMKELVAMCVDGRQKLVDQIKKFEDETRAKCLAILKVEVEAEWNKHGVEGEFRQAEIDDIAQKVSSLTAGGKLTKGAAKELERRVLENKMLQDCTHRRLLELENRSHRADLAAPLTRDHVAHFLFEDEETYNENLSRLISAEVERQRQAEARAIKREDDRKAAEQQARPQEAPQEPPPTPASEYPDTPPKADTAEEKPVADGLVAHCVSCTFEINVPPSVTAAMIEADLRQIMKKAGINSLSSVMIEQLPPPEPELPDTGPLTYAQVADQIGKASTRDELKLAYRLIQRVESAQHQDELSNVSMARAEAIKNNQQSAA